MTNKIVELFGIPTNSKSAKWPDVVREQACPYLGRKCIKVRKSEPTISIGTCTVEYGGSDQHVIICPYRLLQRRQIFTDCLHLLTKHEPGNELHVVPEVSLPGGSIDYFLVSAKRRKVVDFVGVELQTLDTTGTVWPERERFLDANGVPVKRADTESPKRFGMNWKMTAKTILVQLHHKIETFEAVNKHLALVIQDRLLEYMRREFSFGHLATASLGDPMHFHAYRLDHDTEEYHLQLVERVSTDGAGIAACLGLQAQAKVELQVIVNLLQEKLSDQTLLRL